MSLWRPLAGWIEFQFMFRLLTSWPTLDVISRENIHDFPIWRIHPIQSNCQSWSDNISSGCSFCTWYEVQQQQQRQHLHGHLHRCQWLVMPHNYGWLFWCKDNLTGARFKFCWAPLWRLAAQSKRCCLRFVIRLLTILYRIKWFNYTRKSILFLW